MTQEVLLIAEQWPVVQLPTALLGDDSVKPGAAKLTYAYLVLWGRGNGKVWVGRQKLADAVGIKRQALYNHLAALERSGWILRGHDGTRNVITVLRESTVQKCGVPQSRNVDEILHLSGVDQSTQVDTEVEEVKEKEKEKPSPLRLSICLGLLSSEAHPDAGRVTKKLRSLSVSAQRGSGLSSAQLCMAAEMAAEVAEWNRPQGQNGVMPEWSSRAKAVIAAAQYVQSLRETA